MKRLLTVFLAVLFMAAAVSCGGDVSEVEIAAYSSEIYTDADIESAMDTAISYFKHNFSGCKLLEIAYAGDASLEKYKEFAERNNADEVIVLISSFYVDSSGGDGSLSADSTYSGWNWILVRSKNGKWKHVDHGY